MLKLTRATFRTFLRLWCGLWCALVLLCAAPALAASCSPATSGGSAPASWPTYCWIDFASYVDATAQSASGQNFSILLTDGATLAFNVKSSGVGVNAIPAPSWTGAAVGNSAFIGIPGRPVLYTAAAGTVTVTISQITITPPPGVAAVTSYAVVAADAESTNQGESLAFTTNGGNWVILDQVEPQTGNLYPSITNSGTTFTETGATGTVGGYIVGTSNPTTVSTTMVAGGLQGAMFAVRFATISLNKKIVGTRLDPADQFTYQITTTSSGSVLSTGTTTGAGTGPFTAAAVSFASGLPVTLGEFMAPGSVNPLASYYSKLTCLNNAVSNTILPVNLVTTSFDFSGLQFGDGIVCTYTNTPFPRLRVAKALRGTRLANTDQFTVAISQGASTVASITTTGTGAALATNVTAPLIVTAGATYAFSETGAGTTSLSNYNATMTCTNAFAGSTTVLPATPNGTVTPTYGDDITCTISNGAVPRLRIAKAIDGTRLVAGDQFALSIKSGAATLASITTTGTGATITNGTTATAIAVAGTAYTFAESAAGTTVLANYGASMVCSNAYTASATVLPTTMPGTLTPGFGDDILCTITNSTIPRLAIAKLIVGPRFLTTDQFTVRVRQGNTNIVTATTTGTNATATTVLTTVTAGTSYTFSEIAAGGTTLTNYVSTMACVNAATTSTTVLPTTVGGAVVPKTGDSITCTITNIARPRLQLVKALGNPRVADTDQFTVTISGVASSTTGGAGATVTSGATPANQLVTSGTSYALTETASGTTTLANYTAALSCSNSYAGSATVLPTAVGGSVTPANGDAIVCTLTNTARAARAALNILKASSLISDPVNGTVNPKAIPGAILRYFITVSNTGRGSVDAGTVAISDVLPGNVSIYASTGSGAPVQFVDGTVPSGLTFNYASNVGYSNSFSGTAPYTYTPVLDGAGFSSSVTGIRINPGGTMVGAPSGAAPSFTVQFLVRVN